MGPSWASPGEERHTDALATRFPTRDGCRTAPYAEQILYPSGRPSLLQPAPARQSCGSHRRSDPPSDRKVRVQNAGPIIMRTVHRRLPTSRKELSARSWRTGRYSWRRSTPARRSTGADGLLRSGCSVHGTPHGSPHGLLACDSMCASPLKLPMQDMARTIKYWSAAISHVHWASQFKLSWSRQYMPPYLGEA